MQKNMIHNFFLKLQKAQKYSRKTFIIAEIGVVMLALIVIYFISPVSETRARSVPPIIQSTTSVNLIVNGQTPGVAAGTGENPGNQIHVKDLQISLGSAGPFDQDIQAEICVTAGSDHPPGIFCSKTPWASQSVFASHIDGMGWSNWVWPGYNNGLMAPGYAPGIISVSLNYQPLPPGKILTNVKLGLSLYEDNGGPSDLSYSDAVGASTPSISPCQYVYTPNGGGISSAVYSYTYGQCPSGWQYNPAVGSSDEPDNVKIGISGSLQDSMLAQEVTNTIPTAMSPSQSVTTGNGAAPLSITIKNTGGSWATTAQESAGTQSGTCNATYYGGTILDEPGSGSPSSSCSVKVNFVLSDFKLVHSPSTFSISPEQIQGPVILTNVTQTISYEPSYTVTVQEGQSYQGHNCPMQGNGGQPCVITIPEAWSDPSYSGGGYTPASWLFASGESYTFPITSITAPKTAGIYNEKWQMQQNGKPFGNVAIIPITVGSVAGGTLNVSSTNIVTGGPVVASWNVNGPTAESSQGVSSASYKGLPLGGGVANYKVTPGAAQGYAIGTVKTKNFAQASVAGNVFTKTLIAIHNAFTLVAFAGSAPVQAGVCIPSDYKHSTTTNMYECANGKGWDPSLMLTTATPTAEAIIMWYPVAAMNVTTPSVTLDGSGNGTIVLQNSGSAGSELDWTANTTSTWFSISPGSDAVVNGASSQGRTGATKNISVNTDPSKLSTGTYTGTVNVVGTSKYCSAYGSQQSCIYDAAPITITFTGGTCTGSGCTQCTGSCKGSSPTASIIPASSTITLGQSQKLVISTTGATSSCIGSGDWSTTEPCNGTVTVKPSAVGTFTYKIKAGSASASATVTVSNSSPPPPPVNYKPSCTLSVNPVAILVPASSTLTYSCANVSSCALSGGRFSNGQTSTPIVFSGTNLKGAAADAPATNTFYTISCYGTGSYSAVTSSMTAEVTVTNPGRIETNP